MDKVENVRVSQKFLLLLALIVGLEHRESGREEMGSSSGERSRFWGDLGMRKGDKGVGFGLSLSKRSKELFLFKERLNQRFAGRLRDLS